MDVGTLSAECEMRNKSYYIFGSNNIGSETIASRLVGYVKSRDADLWGRSDERRNEILFKMREKIIAFWRVRKDTRRENKKAERR